jgi:predicted RND superfamily exporter protein
LPGVLLKVIAIFYLTGWQLGGVEAISLSILVGTSVDYCFHLVEAYILAGEAVDPTLNKMVTFYFSLVPPYVSSGG